jgi:5-methylcytosine-specific restriction endonuclease McrA
VLIRDNYTCQYCGKKFPVRQLTMDHVWPLSRGGRKSWKNIVTACQKCNQKKGCKTPQEAGMRLLNKPQEPKWLPSFRHDINVRTTPESWQIYLEPAQKAGA